MTLKNTIHEIEETWAKVWFSSIDSNGRRRLWLKLAKMIGNGVQILQAIESIKDRRIASGGAGQPDTIALQAWSDAIHNGSRLSQATEGWVTVEERMLIAAGEQSGTFEMALRSAARVMEARKKIISAVIGGLSYPFVLIMIALGVLYLFGFKIVPAFTKAIQGGGEWHGMAKAMIMVSTFTQNWLWLMLPLLFGFIIVFFLTLPHFDGPVRIKLDRYPPYSIYRILQGSTWLIALSAMVGAGLRIENAMEQLAENAGPWLKRRINECLRGMRSGRSMGDSLARTGYEFPDREIIDDLAVYSALSGFEEALSMLGREWIDEAVEQIQSRMKIIFGICILIVGGLIAFLVSGMIAMQLQISEVFQQSIH